MLELRIFKVKNFSVASVISTIAQISMVAVEFILPLYMQNARDMHLALIQGAQAALWLATLVGVVGICAALMLTNGQKMAEKDDEQVAAKEV